LSFDSTKNLREVPRVVIDARKLCDGGIGVYTENTIKALVSSGLFKVAVIASKQVLKQKSELFKSLADIEIIESNFKKYSFAESFFMPLKLKKRLENSILHFPHYTVPYFLPQNSKVSCTIHDCIHLNSSNIFKRIFSRFSISHALKRSNLVFTVSNYSKNQIENNFYLKNKKIEKISNYIQASLEGISSEKKDYYLCISSDLKHKGLNLLLKAWKEQESTSDLIILGSKSNLKQDNVILKKNCDENELRKLYQNAKALVIPSLEEGFCIPALEALKIGIPVVAFALPCLVENFSDSIWYADKFSSQSLTKAIRQMSNDHKNREKRVKLGKEIAERFNKSSFDSKIVNLFKDLSCAYNVLEEKAVKVA